MHRYPIILTACIGLLGGCGPKLAEDVNPDQAGEALRSALEAWKNGKSRADLESQSPPILMNDMEWGPETHLLDYRMEEISMYGRQAVWKVQIKLQDKAGKVTDRNATYIVDTIPRIVIVRDTFAS